jgi:regulator of nucleoside diphosphate kinase
MTHPPISILPRDYDRLITMAENVAQSDPDLAEFLSRELNRASTAKPSHQPRFVAMGSYVRFRDDTTGSVQDIQLVYPNDADVAARRISILTPVGTALIGLSEGQSIQWLNRNGKAKALTVLKVQSELEAVV